MTSRIYNPKVVYDFTKGTSKDYSERNAIRQMIQEDFPSKDILSVGLQFYNVVIDFPNAYFTISAGTKGQGTENAFEGIITYDLSDIANGNISVKNIAYLPDENHILYKTGDVPPTNIAKVGDYLFVGCLEQGMGVFKLDSDRVPQFNMMLSNEELGVDTTECLGIDKIYTTNTNELIVLNGGGTKHTAGKAYDPIDTVELTVPRIFVITVDAK